VIDRSLNQVLARCIFTSGTTLAALLPMAIWGGPAVAGFAWPMIAGVVIATGSSILFVSGPVLAWLAAGFSTWSSSGRKLPHAQRCGGTQAEGEHNQYAIAHQEADGIDGKERASDRPLIGMNSIMGIASPIVSMPRGAG
jgi:hypothetical protein